MNYDDKENNFFYSFYLSLFILKFKENKTYKLLFYWDKFWYYLG